jgi:hypothetical protein
MSFGINCGWRPCGTGILQDEEFGSLDIADLLRDIKLHRNMSYKELLAYAIKKENQAYRLYSQLANSAKEPVIGQMFAHLAQEEAQHKLKLEIEYDLT